MSQVGTGMWIAVVMGVTLSLAGVGRAHGGEAAQPYAPGSFQLSTKGHGWAITDGQGMTLYTYRRDVEPGKSSCVEECAMAWPAVAADPEAKAHGDWAVIEREDGSLQWAYNDRPLYRYSVDQGPGDTYGEGIGALWALAFIPIPTPPGIKIQKALVGYVAANNERMTLYSPDNGAQPGQLCISNSCPDWDPLVAPWAARDLDGWSVVVRTDGLRQWAYQGRPLYTYSGDIHPAESNGAGQSFGTNGSPAKIVVLQSRPPYPDWITAHDTDAGQMLATLDGKTVYTYDPSRLRSRFLKTPVVECELDCLDPEWVPIRATAEDSVPAGNWSIAKLSDGSRQWAYKGRRLFTNTRDKTQGSFLGYRHGGNRAWNVIMHSEAALVGTLRPP